MLNGFEEKPENKYLVSMGVYGVSRPVLTNVSPETKYGFDDLMRDMLLRNMAVHVEVHTGYWLDIGRPDDYARAIDDFESGREKFLLP